MAAKEPTIQNQVKTLKTHQKSSPLKLQNSEIEAPQTKDHHHHHDQSQSSESKNEEKSKPLDTHQCINDEEGEKFENFTQENLNDHQNEEKESSKKGNENGGFMGPRERLKRHRTEVAGSVWIPEMWGQEDFLKDWIDCSAFDASLVPQGIMLARDALMEEARRSSSGTLRVENSC